MSQIGSTLPEAAKAYRDACKDRDAVEAAFRDACVQKDALQIQQEQAQSRVSTAARFLRLVALHGPVEDWERDYMKDGEPMAGSMLGSTAQRQGFQNMRNAQ